MTTKEAAAKYKVSERTIQRWAQDGAIVAHKNGRAWWIGESPASQKRLQEREYQHGGGKEAERKKLEKLNQRARRKADEARRAQPKIKAVSSLEKPALSGSEKQIKYAESIRNAYLFVQAHGQRKTTNPQKDHIYVHMVETDLQHKSAGWWIENKRAYLTHADALKRPGYYKQK